jgi:hypothetical protein
MTDHELIAVLETLPRPGRITVTTDAGELFQAIGVPTWTDDGWPDTDEATAQLRAAGYVPAGVGEAGWRPDDRGYAIEVRRS